MDAPRQRFNGPTRRDRPFLASVVAQLGVERRLRPVTAVVTGLIAGMAVPSVRRTLERRRGGAGDGWIGFTPVQRNVARLAPGPPVPPGAPPALHDLARVVPVAQTQDLGEATLTLLSLEIYGDGFLVLSRLRWDADPAHPPGMHRSSEVPQVAHDDRGGRYVRWPYGGGGHDREWRAADGFTPALNPTARELRLEVPELRLRQFNWMRDEDLGEQIRPGPWVFTVPLTPEAANDRS